MKYCGNFVLDKNCLKLLLDFQVPSATFHFVFGDLLRKHKINPTSVPMLSAVTSVKKKTAIQS